MKFFKDLAERAVTTFVEAALAGVVVTQLTDVGMWQAAALAGLAAALSVVKSAVASRIGDRDSASTIPSV